MQDPEHVQRLLQNMTEDKKDKLQVMMINGYSELIMLALIKDMIVLLET